MAIKAKLLPRWPADVSATAPIVATKANGAVALSYNSSTLPQVSSPTGAGRVVVREGTVYNEVPALNIAFPTIANNNLIGNVSGSTAAPAAVTGAQANAILPTFTGDTGAGGVKGLVPAPAAGDAAAGRYLKADGTFAVPSGAVSSVAGRTGAVTLDGTDVSFTQSGTGATTRNATIKMRDIVSVKDFGAVGDGTTDDTTAIQAAITAMPAAGGGLYFPAGTYLVSNALTLSKSGVYTGAGYGTNIRTTSATANIFTVTAQYAQVEKMQFTSSVVRTAGWFVDVNASANRFRLSDFWMSGAIGGVRTLAAATSTIERGNIFDSVASTGVCIRIDAGFDVTIRDIIADQASQIFAGVYITNAGDITIEDCQLIRCGQALMATPGAGQVVSSLWANNTFFDTSTRSVYFITAGGSIVRSLFDQCWFSSSLSEGIRCETSAGGVINGVDINGCHIFLNAGNGIQLADTGVSNVRIADCAIANNGGNGVNIAAGVGSVSIQSSRIGNTHGLNGNAGDGITVAAGAGDNIHVVNNDLRGNTGAAMTLGATGSSVITDNNIGYGPWIQYTPTVASVAGSITTLGTVVGRYSRLHKTLLLELNITITTNGTGATAVTATLPSGFTANSDNVISGRENSVTGAMLQGLVNASGTLVTITKYDNTYPGGNGYRFILSGTIELQ